MPPLAQLFAGKPEGAPESDHQRTHADRVQKGVVVLVLDADQPHQRVAVAQYGRSDRLDHRFGVLQRHRLAESHIAHHRAHNLVGLLMHLAGAGHFLAHRSAHQAVIRRAHRGDDFLLDCRLNHIGSHRLLVIEATVGVDIHMLDTGFDDAAQIAAAGQLELCTPERVRHPVAAKFMNKHARFEPGDRNFLEHRGDFDGLFSMNIAFNGSPPHCLNICP